MSRSVMTDTGHQCIPEATVNRLPVYLRALYALAERGIATVSSEELAAAAGVNSAKLRKDLSHLGSYGTRGVGYDVDYLVYQVSRELGRPGTPGSRRHSRDRKSTRLNSSHQIISYAVFCLKKKNARRITMHTTRERTEHTLPIDNG